MHPNFPAIDSPGQLVDELANEVRALSEHGTSGLVLSLGAVLLFLFGLRALLRGLRRVSARFGVDRGRRFGRLARAIQLLVLLLVMGELIQAAARLAPVWVASLVVFVLAPMVLWSSGLVQDLVGGAVAQLRLQLTEGEYVRIGEARGILTRVGIVHLDLRDEFGNLHRIPNRQLNRREVETYAAVPVMVELATPRTLADDDTERLRDGVATSPFRAPGTRVSVERLVGPPRVRVQLFVWSQRAIAPARQHLESIFARLRSARE
jgi:small-conductance mechanosensitive channel